MLGGEIPTAREGRKHRWQDTFAERVSRIQEPRQGHRSVQAELEAAENPLASELLVNTQIQCEPDVMHADPFP